MILSSCDVNCIINLISLTKKLINIHDNWRFSKDTDYKAISSMDYLLELLNEINQENEDVVIISKDKLLDKINISHRINEFGQDEMLAKLDVRYKYIKDYDSIINNIPEEYLKNEIVYSMDKYLNGKKED